MTVTGSEQSELAARLPLLMLRDEARLRRELARGRWSPERAAREIGQAEARVAARRAAVPVLSYPALPVTDRREDLLAAIREHQVVVVAGETGSGKTTQLPKLCLELGRGVRGLIGHTQPRRIAARTVAERIAAELGVPLGDAVGYAVRFTDQVGPRTLVKIMTDGILLAEIRRDRDLLAYDTIIVDEAHERSLNVDFLLGYLHRLLPRRPDLTLVITSATIDPGRFAAHFGGAPVVEVSGRTYPVEVRYRPLVVDQPDEMAEDGELRDGELRDAVTATVDAVLELTREGPGDVLVFCSGEREIRDTAEALTAAARARPALRDLEVLPLYARLSAAEQHRVFEPASGPGRRVVIATNVAETSLTVPGIRYVVDPGTARISRWSPRTRVQRLPIEAVSRASADQRKGRCGRVAAGVCIRLYSEQDFLGRPAFTDPEIQRTNLAAVILSMADLGLGAVADFPFLDPPDRRSVRDGLDVLTELGALEAAAPGAAAGAPQAVAPRLTETGRRLARLPVDPRFARMILEADRVGGVREICVIAAALTIQDPRERPTTSSGAQQRAAELHARFTDPTSDFLTLLAMWDYVAEQQRELSSSAFRRLCKREFLHYLRIREWQDLEGQLRRAAAELGIGINDTPPAPEVLHLALLSGLLSRVGLKDGAKNEYAGVRNARFVLAPGTPLAKKGPRWVVVAELVETTRLFGRVAAKIEPGWIEQLAAHLVARSYSEPHWDAELGSVLALERVTLWGLPLAVGRAVTYGSIDPGLSRELFLRHALVDGDWSTHHAFWARNRALLADAEELEHRARRRDIVIDDARLYDFYDARVPADVVSARHFDAWWKRARVDTPDLLTLTSADLVTPGADPADWDDADQPPTWETDDLSLPLSYVFEPGAEDDGVTLHVPLELLPALRGEETDWLVPGLREELVTALIRGLPKVLRRSFVPAPDTARAALARVIPRAEPLLPALSRALEELTGVWVRPEEWAPTALPAHLRLRLEVTGADGRVVAEGRDVEQLQSRLRPRVQATLAAAAPAVQAAGLTAWTIGTLPSAVVLRRGGHDVQGFPALVDEGTSVAVRVLDSEAAQATAHPLGTRRLLLLQGPSPVRAVQGSMPNAAKLALGSAPGGAAAVLDDCAEATVDALVARAGGPVWDEASWSALLAAVRAGLPAEMRAVVTRTAEILGVAREVARGLSSTSQPALLPAYTDMRAQLAALVHPGFVTAAGTARLPDLLRYVRAIERRLGTVAADPARDRERQRRVEAVRALLDDRAAGLRPGSSAAKAISEMRWMVEELRVSLFAQRLGTPYPVSEQRIVRALDRAA